MLVFYKYVADNFKVPEGFKGKGKIYISFMVEKDGSLTDFEILRDIGFGLGDEAIRVLKESQKWIPGKKNGEIARVKFTLPLQIESKQ